MKKYIAVIFFLSLFAGASAQSVGVYFEAIPDQNMLQLDANRRKDMLDMKKAGMETPVANRLGGKSEITELTDNYLKIKLSEASNFEMILSGDSTDRHITVIRTVCAPQCDSEISFYTTTWEPIINKEFRKPTINDFIKDSVDGNSPEFIKAASLADIFLVKMDYNPKTNTITATNSLKEMMPEEIYSQMSPYIKEEITIPLK